MRVCGIDPGKKGCFVVLDTDRHIAFWLDTPYRSDGIIDFAKVQDLVGLDYVDSIFYEKVCGREGWGAVQVFSFGCSYGQILGFLHDKPHTLISPKKWQTIAHVGTCGDNAKQRSYQSFVRLNPSAKIKKSQDGLIDAFHIARYGLIMLRSKFRDNWEFVELCV